MSFDSYNTGAACKTFGSWNLHTTLPKGMDFFIFLSSASGLVGLRGIGIVGQQKKAPISAESVIQTDPPDIILSAMGHDTKSLAGPAQIESQHT